MAWNPPEQAILPAAYLVGLAALCVSGGISPGPLFHAAPDSPIGLPAAPISSSASGSPLHRIGGPSLGASVGPLAVHRPLGPIASGGLLPPPAAGSIPVVKTVVVGSQPIWATYDTGNGYVYVPNYGGNTESILNGTQVLATVRVGSSPYASVYDASNGDVYVSNQGSANVSVLHGVQLVATVKTGNSPEYSAYDSANQWVYVPNEGSASVTVINGSTVVGTVTVGTFPYNATYDPANGFVYIANEGSSSVTVINGTKVQGTVTVGNAPWSGVYDSANGFVYVPNSGSASVSVLNGTKVQATVKSGSSPLYGGYDDANGFVYQANFAGSSVTVINGTTVAGTVSVGSAPIAATFNPRNGYVYVANSGGSGSISVLNGTNLLTTLGGGGNAQNAVYDDRNGYVYIPNENSNNVSVVVDDHQVVFSEVGLPTNTEWWVNLTSGDTNSSLGGNLSFALPDGVFNYSVSTTNRSFASPVGSVQVLGRATAVALTFTPVRFGLSFRESGLPNGTAWSVDVGGVTLGATVAGPGSITFNETNGSYRYTIAGVPGWTTSNFTGILMVNGTPVAVPLVWTQVTYTVAFQATGLRAGVEWWVNITRGPSSASQSSAILIGLGNGTYSFTVGSLDKTYAAPGRPFTVTGAVQSETVAFSRVTFPVLFTESGLPLGTPWAVTVGPSNLASTSTVVKTTEVNGTYPFTVGRVDGWTTANYSGSVRVNGGSVSTAVAWSQVVYSVTFRENGLPSGARWTVVFNGVSNTSAGSIAFPRTPNGTYAFQISAVPGYTASPTSGAFTVRGSDETRTIVFSAIPPPATHSPAPTFLGLPSTEGYAVVAGVAAIVVIALAGLLLRGRRRSPPTDVELRSPPDPPGDAP